MSLTGAPPTVLASVHESGINDLLTALFTARPRYLTYGLPLFVPSDTMAETAMPSIPFPGVAGGIQYRISAEIPTVDLSPDSSGGSVPVVPGPDQLIIRTNVTLCIDCGRRRDSQSPDDVSRCTDLEVFAVGEPALVGGGAGMSITFDVIDLEIVDITPQALEEVVECLILQVLTSILNNVEIPLPALSAGAFDLTLIELRVEDDQIKVFGTV